MNRRTLRRWMAWLLPLAVLRAFLPTGFMLTADANGLHLAFCPALSSLYTVAKPIAEAHPAAHHALQATARHEAGSAEGSVPHGSGVEHAQPPCLFALAALGVSSDVPHLHAAAQPFRREIATSALILETSAGPARADHIRGPPDLRLIA